MLSDVYRRQQKWCVTQTHKLIEISEGWHFLACLETVKVFVSRPINKLISSKNIANGFTGHILSDFILPTVCRTRLMFSIHFSHFEPNVSLGSSNQDICKVTGSGSAALVSAPVMRCTHTHCLLFCSSGGSRYLYTLFTDSATDLAFFSLLFKTNKLLMLTTKWNIYCLVRSFTSGVFAEFATFLFELNQYSIVSTQNLIWYLT